MSIIVKVIINKPIDFVWEYWTNPIHIMQWNQASADWHCPNAVNDCTVGGKFSYTMAAKDGSMSFDFWGVYDTVEIYKAIAYTLGDERKVSVEFSEVEGGTQIIETFDPESVNPEEMQKTGWQLILDSMKSYCESH